MPKYPIRVKLLGRDGNAFAILGGVKMAMRKYGVPEEEVKKYIEEATSGDYDKLLQTTMEYVEVT